MDYPKTKNIIFDYVYKWKEQKNKKFFPFFLDTNKPRPPPLILLI